MKGFSIKWHIAMVVFILAILFAMLQIKQLHDISHQYFQKVHTALEHEIRMDAESEMNMMILLNHHIYHYDELTDSLHRLEEGLWDIRRLLADIPMFTKDISRLQASVNIQKEAINDFKGNFGILMNSQHYLPTLINTLIRQHPHRAMALRRYSNMTYQYVLALNDDTLKESLYQMLKYFSDMPELTHHIRIILSYHDRVQKNIYTAMTCGTPENIQSLSKHVDQQYENDLKTQHLQQYSLEVMVFLLLMYLSFLVWRVVSLLQEKSKKHEELLEMQAQLEEKVRDLSKLEQRFRKLFDVIPDAVIVHQYGRCLFANPAAIKMYGHKKDSDLVGENVLKYIHKDDRSKVAQRIRDSKLGDTVPLLLEKHIRLDGSILFVEVQGVSFEEESETVWLVLLHDVTQRLQEEKEAMILKSAMEHRQRLESLGVLAGGIAHDFNNLLTAIMGNVELLEFQFAANKGMKKYISNILKASDKAASLCQQMLAYSGKGKFIVQITKLTTLIQDMVELLQVSMKKKVHICYKLDESLPMVQVDRAQIQQIIMNLITNANEAMDKGQIICRTGVCHRTHEQLKGMMHAWELEAGDFVFVEIEDQGSGMDQETLHKIFEPFFTTKFTGRGLGMSAVLGIVRGHHGALDVHSVVGKGTVFRLLLPLDQSLTQSKPMMKALNIMDEGQRHGTVLLVDDEDMIREVACMMLENMGFNVLQASDGLQAVDIYKEHGVAIDVVLLDMTMPKMDGKACFHALKALNPDVKVVISSGYHSSEIHDAFSEKSLAAIVQKPYRYQELHNVLMPLLS